MNNIIAKSVPCVPKLRFPGFSDAWEEKKLGEISKTVNGLTYSPSDIRDNGVLVLRSSNIKQGRLDFKDCVFVDENLRFNASNKGDILICVRNGSQNLIGKNVYIDKELPKTTHGAFMSVLRSESNIFISQLFQTSRYYSQVSADLGARINSINNSQLLKYKFSFPTEDEQEKIAGFLGVVDEKIDLLKKRKELLEEYKKGVMQQIFSQKIRFKDKNGDDYADWQEKTLSEISFSETSPLSANQIVGKTGKYKVYGASGVIQTLNKYDYEYDYIAVVKDGAGAGRISFCEPKSSVLGTMIVIQPRHNIDKKFLFYLLHLLDFKKYTSGSTIPHVYYKQYSKEKFFVPDYKVQNIIAEFFSKIDEKIKSEERKLASAKEFKKALLQQMFV